MPTATSFPLRLGAQGLPAAEAGLVRAWLLLAGTEPGFAWRLSTEPPYDALLMDGAHLSLRGEGFSVTSDHLAVLGQTEALPAGAMQLERPLRQEALLAWLVRLTPASSQRHAATPEPKDTAPTSSGMRWKLRRWPPQELLRESRDRVRMATLLSRRPLSVDELAQASGVDRAACQVFVQMLQGFHLLEAGPPPAAAPSPRARSAAAPASTLARVVRGLRQRLGLST